MKFSIFFRHLILLLCHVDAWIERKMMPSWSEVATKLAIRRTGSPSVVPFQPQRKQRNQQHKQSPQSGHPDVLLLVTEDVSSMDNVNNMDNSSVSPPLQEREHRKLSLGKGKKTNIVSRTVQICSDWNITVWEFAKPAPVVETFNFAKQQGLSLTQSYAETEPPLLDPFGLVCWPGSVVAAQEMKEYRSLFEDKRVLILGAGTGVEAQAAAMLGAKHVIATDVHPTTLRLCKYGAEQAGLSSILSTTIFDLRSIEPLPSCDIIVAADVLYNDDLALLVVKRILESQQLNNPPPQVLVTDSQRYVADFDTILSERLQRIGQSPVTWRSRWLPTFTGSGVAIDDDVTYEVKARVLWVGTNW